MSGMSEAEDDMKMCVDPKWQPALTLLRDHSEPLENQEPCSMETSFFSCLTRFSLVCGTQLRPASCFHLLSNRKKKRI